MKKKKIILIILIVSVLLIINHWKGEIFHSITSKYPSDIENVSKYEKKRIIKLLEKEYPGEEFEIVQFLENIMLLPSKEHPFTITRATGDVLLVRPNGEEGKEFKVYYYYDDRGIISDYKDPYEDAYNKVNNMVYEYVEPIIAENLKGKKKGEDYNIRLGIGSGLVTELKEWFESIETIDDYFYTLAYPNKPSYKWQNEKGIYIDFYMNINEVDNDNIEDILTYYNCFKKVVDKLSENLEQGYYSIVVRMYMLSEEEFERVKGLSNQTLENIKRDIESIDSYGYNKRKFIHVQVERYYTFIREETSQESFIGQFTGNNAPNIKESFEIEEDDIKNYR